MALILILAGVFLIIYGIAAPLITALGDVLALLPFIGQFFAGLTANISTSISSAVSQIVKGGLAILAGYGLFRDEEWALGMAVLLLILVLVDAIVALATLGLAFFSQALNPTNLIWIVLLAVSAFGIVYLIITRERYD